MCPQFSFMSTLSLSLHFLFFSFLVLSFIFVNLCSLLLMQILTRSSQRILLESLCKFLTHRWNTISYMFSNHIVLTTTCVLSSQNMLCYPWAERISEQREVSLISFHYNSASQMLRPISLSFSLRFLVNWPSIEHRHAFCLMPRKHIEYNRVLIYWKPLTKYKKC